jgi:hypothetical protein
VIWKNIVFPLIMIVILVLLKPAYHIALLLLIESAVPPVTVVPIFTERAGGNKDIVNQFTVGSFLFSIISIPIMIALFSMFFTPL